MKRLIFLAVVIALFTVESKAQSDTLLIKLKNGQQEKIACSDMRKIVFENVTSVTEIQNGKTDLRLEGNHPNPFAEQTSLEFELSSPGTVLIVIYDNTGKPIQTLRCENCQAGKNSLQWNGMNSTNSKVQSGTYFYEVRYGNEVQSRKMILIK